MGLEDSSQRNLDRVGGIIAAILFSVCLVAHMWQWLRHKFHPFAATSMFLLLRTIGWLLAFIGAVKDDSALNKRGYIVNAVSFWLMALGGALLLVRWSVCCRGKTWNSRAWSAASLASIPCVVMGAVDAAGQIDWLNNPTEDPKATIKAASIGFLVIVSVYALVSLLTIFRSQLIYQKPLVRLSFFLTGAFLLLRCIFWMLIAMNIVDLDEPKRLIFLFCLATSFELLTAAVWGFFPVAKNLKLPDHELDNLHDLPSVKVVDDSTARPSDTRSSPAPSDSELIRAPSLRAVFGQNGGDEDEIDQEPGHGAAVIPTTQYVSNPGMHSYSLPQPGVAPNSNSYGNPQPGFAPNSHSYGTPQPGIAPNSNSYGSPHAGIPANTVGFRDSYHNSYNMPQANAGLGQTHLGNSPDVRFSGVSGNTGVNDSFYSNNPNASHEMTAWGPAVISASPVLNADYSPRPHSYLPQSSHASMQMQATPILPQHPPRVQHLQTFSAQPGSAGGPAPHMINTSVSFSTPNQSPYIGMAGQPPHASFARTPYPAMAVNTREQQPLGDTPQPAFTADYFNDNSGNDVSLSRDVQTEAAQPPLAQGQSEPGALAEPPAAVEPQPPLAHGVTVLPPN
ncbi:hypothetical protein IWW39_002643 [Coemansia spiralis]|uniref:Uncharacterized protein n=1 Tax=Coemansia spiralis TaxID=417178 RepID=A0A9W8GFI8_9FUNG|nr:hypothetical protein IWW39_002643 [Coemansia spiralis]